MRSSKRTLHHEDVAGLHGDRLRRETLPHPAIARVHNPPALVLNEDLRGAQDVPGRQEPAARAVPFERAVDRVRLRESVAQAVFVQSGGVWRGGEPAVVRRDPFEAAGLLQLPRGWARLVPEHRAVQLLPDHKRFGIALRTAWPLNGFVHYAALDERAPVTLTKRMPWSSALLTGAWFLTVAGGTLVYLVAYALAGGLSSASGAFLGVALSGLGLLVCLFGLVVVIAG